MRSMQACLRSKLRKAAAVAPASAMAVRKTANGARSAEIRPLFLGILEFESGGAYRRARSHGYRLRDECEPQ